MGSSYSKPHLDSETWKLHSIGVLWRKLFSPLLSKKIKVLFVIHFGFLCFISSQEKISFWLAADKNPNVFLIFSFIDVQILVHFSTKFVISTFRVFPESHYFSWLWLPSSGPSHQRVVIPIALLSCSPSTDNSQNSSQNILSKKQVRSCHWWPPSQSLPISLTVKDQVFPKALYDLPHTLVNIHLSDIVPYYSALH